MEEETGITLIQVGSYDETLFQGGSKMEKVYS